MTKTITTVTKEYNDDKLVKETTITETYKDDYIVPFTPHGYFEHGTPKQLKPSCTTDGYDAVTTAHN